MNDLKTNPEEVKLVSSRDLILGPLEGVLPSEILSEIRIKRAQHSAGTYILSLSGSEEKRAMEKMITIIDSIISHDYASSKDGPKFEVRVIDQPYINQ